MPNPNPTQNLDLNAEFARALPIVTKYLYRYVGSEAEDCAMDACIKALQNIDKYDGRAKFSTWLVTIARNTALDAIRKHKPIYTDNAVFLENKGGSYEIDDEPDYTELHAAIASLSEKHQEVIQLHYVEGLKYREIAERIGKPIGTVMSRLSQAKLKLQADNRVVEDGW
jgi:RNA polymerase sigma-70 factor (ECF subfamily)